MNRRKMLKALGAAGGLGLIDFRALTQTPTASKMKTIGILGGIGPQATMDFEWRVHQATPVFPLQPDPGLLAGAKKLGTMARSSGNSGTGK